MGFFKDFKADLTQAVNELLPDSDEMVNEYDDEDMVDTLKDDIEAEPEISDDHEDELHLELDDLFEDSFDENELEEGYEEDISVSLETEDEEAISLSSEEEMELDMEEQIEEYPLDENVLLQQTATEQVEKATDSYVEQTRNRILMKKFWNRMRNNLILKNRILKQ